MSQLSPSKILTAVPSPSLINPNNRCSTPMYLCSSLKASSRLNVITSLTRGENLASISSSVLSFLVIINSHYIDNELK